MIPSNGASQPVTSQPSQHFLERLESRHISLEVATEVFWQADAYFYDSLTGNYVAVKLMDYRGSNREIALTYNLTGSHEVTFITIHPLKSGQKERRIQSNRWYRL